MAFFAHPMLLLWKLTIFFPSSWYIALSISMQNFVKLLLNTLLILAFFSFVFFHYFFFSDNVLLGNRFGNQGVINLANNFTCGRNYIMGNIVTFAAPYLYPFVVEYSLIAAGVIIAMWKSIGSNPRYVFLMIQGVKGLSRPFKYIKE